MSSLINSDKYVIHLKKFGFINYVLACFLFLSASTVYFQNDQLYRKLLSAFLFVLCIIFFYSITNLIRNKEINYRYILALLVYYSVMIIVFLRNIPGNSRLLVNVITYIFFPFIIFNWLYYQFRRQRSVDLFVAFKNIVVTYAIVSLILYFIVMFFHINSNITIEINWGQKRVIYGYFGLLFNTQGFVPFLGLNLLRNTGIFTEAPMYSFVLTLALLILLFIETQKTHKKLWLLQLMILLITMVTTTSTTGVFIAILALYLYVYKNIPQSVKTIMCLFLPVIILVLVILLIAKYSTGRGSVSFRINDITASYQAWLQHPFLGNGWGNTAAVQQYMDSSRLIVGGNDGLSSGLLASLALNGFFQTSLLYFVPYVWYSHKFKKYALPFLLIILLLNAIVDNSFIMLTFSFYMYVQVLFNKHDKLDSMV